MHLCLFEDSDVTHLSPVAQTRGVYQIRTGAFTTLMRLWEVFDRPNVTLHARQMLAPLIQSQTGLPVNELPEEEAVLFINGRVTDLSPALAAELKRVQQSTTEGKLFLQDNTVIAAWVPQPISISLDRLIGQNSFEGLPTEQVEGATLINRLWHLIDGLQDNLRHDLSLMHRLHTEEAPASLHKSITMINPADIFIAPDAKIHAGAIISAEDGPVFIDQQAKVMEGAIVKGPLYLGKQSVIKARADVSKSALGPVCKAGGEVTEAILQSFSNKAHEGFLGHAYMGSWCNIGAGTNASNLKNDYSETSFFNESLRIFEPTGRQFLGTIMADYSKIGISSMLNTATLMGVGCNLFGSGFMPRHLPSFSWGGPEAGFQPYRLDKAFESIQRVMARRDRIFSQEAMQQLELIFNNAHHNKSALAV